MNSIEFIVRESPKHDLNGILVARRNWGSVPRIGENIIFNLKENNKSRVPQMFEIIEVVWATDDSITAKSDIPWVQVFIKHITGYKFKK